MKGFKEDFAAWKGSLSDEDKKLVAFHRKDPYDKKYLKALVDDPTPLKSKEKLEEFSQIFQKFMDSEVKDYKKNKRLPTDDDLFDKRIEAGNFDFSLQPRVVQIDRDAMRRFDFASERMKHARDTDTDYIPCSPMAANFLVQNNDTVSHQALLDVVGAALEILKKSKSADEYAKIEKEIAVPPMGEHYVLKNIPVELNDAFLMYSDEISKMYNFKTEEEEAAFIKEHEANGDDLVEGLFFKQIKEWTEASESLEKEVEESKAFFKNLKDEGKSKADVVKAIFEQFKKDGYPVQPLEEDTLKELAKMPALPKEELDHPWGKASTLWKSEAYDPFGNQYLLGIYETPEEALKVFNEWNAEYEQSREVVAEEIKQFQKETEAIYLKNAALQEVIYKEFADARAEYEAK